MADLKVVIADDHPVLRGGIRSLLSSIEGYEVVAEASTGTGALDSILDNKPDIAILDVSMPELSGIVVATRAMEVLPELKVIMLSMHSEPTYAIDAFRAGALAYVLKDSPAEEILTALEKIGAGNKYASPGVAEFLFNDLVEMLKSDKRPSDPFDTLSEREKEVLSRIAQGLTSKHIAEELFISVSTVKSHRNKIMKKLAVGDMASLVKIAIRKGLIT